MDPPRRQKKDVEKRIQDFQPRQAKADVPDSFEMVIVTTVTETIGPIQTKMGIRTLREIDYIFRYKEKNYFNSDTKKLTIPEIAKLCDKSSSAKPIYAIKLIVHDTHCSAIVIMNVIEIDSQMQVSTDQTGEPGLILYDKRVSSFSLIKEHFTHAKKCQTSEQPTMTWSIFSIDMIEKEIANGKAWERRVEMVDGMEVTVNTSHVDDENDVVYMTVKPFKFGYGRLCGRTIKRKAMETVREGKTDLTLSINEVINNFYAALSADDFQRAMTFKRRMEISILKLKEALNDGSTIRAHVYVTEDLIVKNLMSGESKRDVEMGLEPPLPATHPSV